MQIYRVQYVISGEIEIAAPDADDAYQQVRNMTIGTLCDLGDPWVHIEEPIPISAVMRRIDDLATQLRRECGPLLGYFSAVQKTDGTP